MADQLDRLLEEGREVLRTRKNPGHYLLNDVVDSRSYHRWVLNCISILEAAAPQQVSAIKAVHQPGLALHHEAEQIYGILESAVNFIRNSKGIPPPGQPALSPPAAPAPSIPAASRDAIHAGPRPRGLDFVAKYWILLIVSLVLVIAAAVGIVQRKSWVPLSSVPFIMVFVGFAALTAISLRLQKSTPWKRAFLIGMVAAVLFLLTQVTPKLLFPTPEGHPAARDSAGITGDSTRSSVLATVGTSQLRPGRQQAPSAPARARPRPDEQLRFALTGNEIRAYVALLPSTAAQRWSMNARPILDCRVYSHSLAAMPIIEEQWKIEGDFLEGDSTRALFVDNAHRLLYRDLVLNVEVLEGNSELQLRGSWRVRLTRDEHGRLLQHPW